MTPAARLGIQSGLIPIIKPTPPPDDDSDLPQTKLPMPGPASNVKCSDLCGPHRAMVPGTDIMVDKPINAGQVSYNKYAPQPPVIKMNVIGVVQPSSPPMSPYYSNSTSATTSGTSTTHIAYNIVGNSGYAITDLVDNGTTMDLGPAMSVHAGKILTNKALFEPADLARQLFKLVDKLKIEDGTKVTLELSDGAKLVVDGGGSYHLDDKDAKTVYKACRIKEFNRYLNASDLLEDFIKFLGTKGIRQSEVLDVPVELFINWLVLKAAEADGEPSDAKPIDNHPKLLAHTHVGRYGERCKLCRRFISKFKALDHFNFCNGDHAKRYWDKLSKLRQSPESAERNDAPIEGERLMPVCAGPGVACPSS